jgi:hypothetical protein
LVIVRPYGATTAGAIRSELGDVAAPGFLVLRSSSLRALRVGRNSQGGLWAVGVIVAESSEVVASGWRQAVSAVRGCRAA